MRYALSLRWAVLTSLLKHPRISIPIVLAVAWGLSGQYDNFSSQWAPDWLRPHLRRTSEVIADMWNLLGWWWVFLFLAIGLIGMFEVAVAQEKRFRQFDWKERIRTGGRWKLSLLRREPIKWNNRDTFLTRTTRLDETRIPSFSFPGVVASKRRDVRLREAFILSLVEPQGGQDHEEIHCWIEGGPRQNDVLIKKGTAFRLRADIPAEDGNQSGPTIREFRRRFSFFRFVCRTDRGDFEQEFTVEDVDAFFMNNQANVLWGEPRQRGRYVP